MGPTGSWFAVAPIVLQIHQLFSNTQHELLKSMCEHRTLSFINITFCISTCVQLVLWCKFVVSICRFIVQPWFYLVVNICFSAICYHYDDVIMSTIASQITSLTIVYSIVYPGADQSKHQSSVSLAFVWGIHRGPVNSPHKWPVTQNMFPFDDVIMIYFTAGTGIPVRPLPTTHYSAVMMDAMASQITSIAIVYSTVCSGADQRKRQRSASLAFLCTWPLNSPHKWPVTRKMFSFDDVIMNNRILISLATHFWIFFKCNVMWPFLNPCPISLLHVVMVTSCERKATQISCNSHVCLTVCSC